MSNPNLADFVSQANLHGTPLYLYQKNVIETQVQQLKSSFTNSKTKIFYACKANSNVEILTIIKELGLGVDTVSPEEFHLCLSLGFTPDNILYTPSFPKLEDLFIAMDKGLKVHVNSIEYIPLLAEKRSNIKIGIRINPEIELGDNYKISTGHIDSKFGIPVSKIEDALVIIKKNNVKINALHLHAGSEIADWKTMAKAADRIFDLIPLFPDLEYIDLGSGFKVKFKPDDKEVDIDSYAQHVKNRLYQLDKKLDIILEPGKFLVSDAGVFITQVEIVKEGFQTKFAGVNSGFNHLIRPMYYDAYHEIINISNPNGEKELYDVVGYLCEEDTFAYKRSIAKIKRGDFLLFKNAGAYCYSMSSNYNSRSKPKEIVI